MSDTPRIYVADLAAYNNGKLRGVWIDCDQDADAIHDAICAMLRGSPYANVQVDCPEWRCDGGKYGTEGTTCPTCSGTGKVLTAEEWRIDDTDGFEGIDITRAGDAIDAAVLHAAMLDKHGRAWAEYVSWRDVEYANSEDDFLDCYCGVYASAEVYAEELLEETDGLSGMPEHLRCYFDFEAFARDLELNGDYYFAEHGYNRVYVFRNS